MPNQDLLFPILPRPQGRVTRENSKVRKVSERPVISTSENEHSEPTAEELERVAKALEQQERERRSHPKPVNKKVEQLQEVQEQQDGDDTPHLDLEV